VLNRLSEYFLFQWQLAKKLTKGRTNSPLSTLIIKQISQKRFNARAVLHGYSDELSKLRTSNEYIQIIDLGAGSKKMCSSRRISDMLQNSATTGKYGDLLFALPTMLKSSSILELGTNLGVGTHLLAGAQAKAKVVSIEGCPNTFQFTKKRFAYLSLPNVQLINSSFSEYISNLSSDNRFDFVFIDGHHDGAAMSEYFEGLLPFLEDKSYVLLDDVRWSKDMYHHAMQLCEHRHVVDTCDFYRMILLEIKKS
jgi:predicted O-methyltransferase YrrM